MLNLKQPSGLNPWVVLLLVMLMMNLHDYLYDMNIHANWSTIVADQFWVFVTGSLLFLLAKFNMDLFL
jgi:hypothetical protein